MSGIDQVWRWVILEKRQSYLDSVECGVRRGDHLTVDLKANVDGLDVVGPAELDDDYLVQQFDSAVDESWSAFQE